MEGRSRESGSSGTDCGAAAERHRHAPIGDNGKTGTEKNKRAAKVLLLCCQSNELMESVVLRVQVEVRMEGGAAAEEDGDGHGDDAEGNEYPFDAAHGG